MRDDFLKYVNEAANEFSELVSKSSKPVRIIGNLDTDGITSASIISKALMRGGIKYSLSIIKQLNDEIYEALRNEDYLITIFVDLGSSSVKRIGEVLSGDVFILDHHPPDINDKKFGNVRQINPHVFGIDGSKDIAAAGVTYLFAKALDEANIDVSHLALVGAIGDIQENMGFKGMNEGILEDALKSELVEVRETLRLFGMQTKPIHKVLEYSTNPYIPGVTGNEKGAIKFIEDAGVKVYDKVGEFRRLVNLGKQELDRLVTAIEMKKVGGENDIPLVGPVFLLKNEDDNSLKKDLREFSTLLNSCGRMGYAGLGVGVCLGDVKATKKAFDVLRSYRKEIIDAMNWFHENRRTQKIIEKKGYVLILAEGNIRDTIIGTISSLISKSNLYLDGTIVVGAAYTLDGFIKLSLRIAGHSGHPTDLRSITKEVVSECGGYGGGHSLAAGASIPQEKESMMIKKAIEVLDKLADDSAVVVN